MTFGPWMSNEGEIDYVIKGSYVSVGTAYENGEWKLISANVMKKVVTINPKDKKYKTQFPNLFYYFIIERHASQITTVVGGEMN